MIDLYCLMYGVWWDGEVADNHKSVKSTCVEFSANPDLHDQLTPVGAVPTPALPAPVLGDKRDPRNIVIQRQEEGPVRRAPKRGEVSAISDKERRESKAFLAVLGDAVATDDSGRLVFSVDGETAHKKLDKRYALGPEATSVFPGRARAAALEVSRNLIPLQCLPHSVVHAWASLYRPLDSSDDDDDDKRSWSVRHLIAEGTMSTLALSPPSTSNSSILAVDVSVSHQIESDLVNALHKVRFVGGVVAEAVSLNSLRLIVYYAGPLTEQELLTGMSVGAFRSNVSRIVSHASDGFVFVPKFSPRSTPALLLWTREYHCSAGGRQANEHHDESTPTLLLPTPLDPDADAMDCVGMVATIHAESAVLPVDIERTVDVEPALPPPGLQHRVEATIQAVRNRFSGWLSGAATSAAPTDLHDCGNASELSDDGVGVLSSVDLPCNDDEVNPEFDPEGDVSVYEGVATTTSTGPALRQHRIGRHVGCPAQMTIGCYLLLDESEPQLHFEVHWPLSAHHHHGAFGDVDAAAPDNIRSLHKWGHHRFSLDAMIPMVRAAMRSWKKSS